MGGRWVCPKCGRKFVDVNAAMDHEEDTGHPPAEWTSKKGKQ